MNLIRFVSKSKIGSLPKANAWVAPNSNFKLPSEVLNELRLVGLSGLTRADGIIQFLSSSGIEVSDPLSTSVLHLLENDGGSKLDPLEAAD